MYIGVHSTFPFGYSHVKNNGYPTWGDEASIGLSIKKYVLIMKSDCFWNPGYKVKHANSGCGADQQISTIPETGMTAEKCD